MYGEELPDTVKSFKKVIDNFYCDLDEKILCRIVPNDDNRNQTSIIPVLPKSLEDPAFEFFHSEMGGDLGIYQTLHRLNQHFFVTSALTELEDYAKSSKIYNLRKKPKNLPSSRHEKNT